MKEFLTLDTPCPHCGGKLRHEQIFHVVYLVCNDCENEILVQPMGTSSIRPGEQQPVINPSLSLLKLKS